MENWFVNHMGMSDALGERMFGWAQANNIPQAQISGLLSDSVMCEQKVNGLVGQSKYGHILQSCYQKLKQLARDLDVILPQLTHDQAASFADALESMWSIFNDMWFRHLSEANR